jgi:hypothetical protein
MLRVSKVRIILSMNIRRIAKILSINVILILLSAELLSIAYVTLKKPYVGYLEQYPTYLGFSMDDKYMPEYDPLGPHIIDSTYPWSTWHPRNSQFRHRLSCFDVMMRFNSEGTRGPLPEPSDTNTVFFVGDSYTEGYGLPEDSTISVMYSKQTGMPALNLGCSGHVGTTQFSLIYEYFAQRYRHRRVYVLMFLSNDFVENDIRRYSSFFGDKKRYRPYRADSSDLGRLEYMGSPDSSYYSWNGYRRLRASGEKNRLMYGMRSYLKDVGNSIPSKLYNLSYLSRVVNVVRIGLREKLSPELKYTDRDLAILDYDIRSITQTADKHGAQVTFLNLPDRKMFDKDRDGVKEQKYAELEEHISELMSGTRHRYLSYYRYLKDSGTDPDSIRFQCDLHYNARGAMKLAEFLKSNP